MNLPEALRKQKEGFLEVAPKETVAVMKEAIDNLSSSGIIGSSLQINSTAPDFSLEDTNDKVYNLYSLLNKGPVILKFFRGDW